MYRTAFNGTYPVAMPMPTGGPPIYSRRSLTDQEHLYLDVLNDLARTCLGFAFYCQLDETQAAWCREMSAWQRSCFEGVNCRVLASEATGILKNGRMVYLDRGYLYQRTEDNEYIPLRDRRYWDVMNQLLSDDEYLSRTKQL